MRDYWLIQYILAGIGWGYLGIALVAIALALWLPKERSTKFAVALVVFVLASILPFEGYLEYRKEKEAAALQQVRLVKAKALFAERCKTAGEKIYRTVQNVDGVVWMKWRTQTANFDDQFKLDDPYGNDCGGDDCILRLLRATDGLELDPQRKLPYHAGYRFVESVDPKTGKAYRYTLQLYRPYDRDKNWLDSLVRAELVKTAIDRPTARYGITWDDVSTREDRQHWIAGGSLKAIDLQTDEILGERVGYMMDLAQGSQAGGRSPWLFAEYAACPAFDRSESNSPIKESRSRQFVQRVLQTAKGD